MLTTAATPQLQFLINVYKKFLPIWTFPFIPLAIAAAFQSIAWLAGPIFFQNYSLIPRILILWLFAAGEYTFMSPTMNAGVEVLGMSEPLLVTIYQVMTLVIFMLINIFVFKKPFPLKYAVSFIFLAMAVYVAYMW